MRKTFSVLGLAAAVFVVALALMTVGGAGEALAGKKGKCPEGTQLFARVCIDTEARPKASFDAASADCADERRRLPTGAELEAFRQQEGITLGTSSLDPWEWTGDIVPPNLSVVIDDQGLYSHGEHHETVELPFRCVT